MEGSRHLLQMLVIALLSTANGQHCDICPRCESSATNNTAICRCDQVCNMFNDCCCESSSSDGATTNFKCQSTYVDPNIPVIAENEAFLMISSCPGSWVNPENSTIESNCIQPSSPLPPVTDTSTGLVYRNEYCALCHNVAEIKAWGSKLTCSTIVHDLITSQNLSIALHSDPDILKRECTVCSFVPLTDLPCGLHSSRSCVPSVDTCLSLQFLREVASHKLSSQWYRDVVANCTFGPKGSVQIERVAYRNMACAACNGVFYSNYPCLELSEARDAVSYHESCSSSLITTVTTARPTEALFKSTTSKKPYELPYPERIPSGIQPTESVRVVKPLPFTVTLSNLGNGDFSLSSQSGITIVSIACPESQVLIGTDCRSSVCPSGYSETGGSCSFISPTLSTDEHQNSTVFNCSRSVSLIDNSSYVELHNNTVVINDTGLIVEVLDYDELGRPIICLNNNDTPYLNCNSTFVKLNRDDYEDFLNGSILFQNRVLDVMFNDSEDGLPLVCYDLIRPTTKLLFVEDLPGIQELTYIGCSLSVLGTVAVVFTYSIFKELQTFPGLILINVCVPLFFTSLIFLIGSPVIQSYPLKELCSAVAIFLHYFYLSQFSWMTIFSFETTKTFYQARQLVRRSKQEKRKCYFLYSVIGWILPLSILIATTVLSFTTDYVMYGVSHEGEMSTCWINHKDSLIITFLLPLVISLALNFVFIAAISLIFCKAYREQSRIKKTNVIAMVRVWLAVFTITGFTWLFGFLAILRHISWMWYLFVCFNSTLGFGLFLTFIFTRKVLNLYKSLIKKKFQFMTRPIEKNSTTTIELNLESSNKLQEDDFHNE